MSVHKFGGMSQEPYKKQNNALFDSKSIIPFIKSNVEEVAAREANKATLDMVNKLYEIIPRVTEENRAIREYIDTKLRKNYVGYVPILEADVSQTGFIARASSAKNGYSAYGAFNNLNEEGENGTWMVGNDSPNPWIRIACPCKVIVWRFGIMTTKMREADINSFTFEASNDSLNYTTLLTTNTTILGSDSIPTYFNIINSTEYQYYKITINSCTQPNFAGIHSLQLFIYSK